MSIFNFTSDYKFAEQGIFVKEYAAGDSVEVSDECAVQAEIDGVGKLAPVTDEVAAFKAAQKAVKKAKKEVADNPESGEALIALGQAELALAAVVPAP